MRMRVFYLDCHETGLCCYLVIHIQKPFTSIIAVLLPFVTYLLTLSRNSHNMSYEFIFAKDYWVLGLCPSSVVLKNTTFRKLDLFVPPGERVRGAYSLASVSNC
jgi:hypothetical protein